jgi:hypothetical protein
MVKKADSPVLIQLILGLDIIPASGAHRQIPITLPLECEIRSIKLTS